MSTTRNIRKNFDAFNKLTTNNIVSQESRILTTSLSKSKSKNSSTSLYFNEILLKKLEIVGFFKRKKSISSYISKLIEKELKTVSDDDFNSAVKLFINEKKDQKDRLKDLGIL